MITAFALEKGIVPVDVKALARAKGKVWVDCTDITCEEADLLKQAYDLHPLTADDLVSKNIRVKIEEFPTHLFCVFYGVEHDKPAEIDFVVGERFLITNHFGKVDTIEHLKQDHERLKAQLEKGTDFLFHWILDHEVDQCVPALNRLGERIDLFERRAVQKPSSETTADIYKIKRELNVFWQLFSAQREKTGTLAKSTFPFISKKAVPYFRDVYDHMIRISDEVDRYRDAASTAFDVYTSTVTLQMNRAMKLLSIITTIVLPLTVLSGIFGMNFAVIPGITDPHGFWFVIGAMAALCTTMLILFKRNGLL